MLSVFWIVQVKDWRPRFIAVCGRLLGVKDRNGGLWRYVQNVPGKPEKRREIPYHEQMFDWCSTRGQPLRASVLSALALVLGSKGTNWCPWDDKRSWGASSELNRLRAEVEAMEK